VKSWISLILAVIFLIAIVIFNIRQPKKAVEIPNPALVTSPTAIPTPTLSSNDCVLTDMQGTVTFEPGAGNVLGTIKLTNISNHPCMMSLSNTIQLVFLPTIKNISTKFTDPPSNSSYELSPKSSLYALIRMPNGPQCSTPIHQVQASLNYKINSSQTLTFMNQTKEDFMINACSSPSEITTVEISSFSSQTPE